MEQKMPMRHLVSKLQELEEREFKVVVSRGTLALQQTERNRAKAEIIDALYKDIKEAIEPEGFQIYETSYGPVIEFLNEKVEDRVLAMSKPEEKDTYTGFTSIQIDAIMKNLDTNGALDEVDHHHVLRQKEDREEARAKMIADKMKRDAEMRAEKARRREAEILRMTALKQEQEELKESGE